MRVNNRILAVDDNPTNLAVIEESLQGRFNLRLARDGNEALRVAPTFQPDVVLLDVMMPGLDGFEVCSRLKNDQTLGNPQILMVSACTDMDNRLRGYHAGADDYVTKPFSEEELCAKVCAGLRRGEMYGIMRSQFAALCGSAGEALEMVSHLRDSETGDHIARMRIYSHLLAADLRASESTQVDDVFLDDLYHASALHDIGKVAIPDSILRKPGRLTDAEREHMKQHAAIGESILNRLAIQQPEVTMFRMAAEIARWHHECFDGSGYPDGLRGDAIPLSARIVKVADVFDAITSARVYKPKQSPEEARDHIIGRKGTDFDPVVVDAMLRIFNDLGDLCLNDDALAFVS